MTAGYAYNKAEIPATVNPFPQVINATTFGIITTPVPIYQTYTPENSASFAIDYERAFMGAKFAAHLDANYGDGFYTNNTDFAFNPDRTVSLKNTKGDDSFIVNGRLSLAEIPAGGGTATISVWSRNLLDEEHLFFKGTAAPAQGFGGFFNEPRTFGIEVGVKM